MRHSFVSMLLISIMLTLLPIAAVSGVAAQAPSVESAAVPALVPLTGIQAVAAGGSHTCALTTGGDVLCWGDNTFGQLGDSNAPGESALPVMVAGLDGTITAVAAGSAHTCALTTSGAVKCWGADDEGQLGDETLAMYSDTPVSVAGLDSGIIAIDAGSDSMCALTASGGVKCWGSNDLGQIGVDPATTYSSDTPLDVSSLNSLKAIAVGASHSCALPESGGAKCWGRNSKGELGDGNKPVDSYEPVSVSIFNRSMKAVSVGGSHSCAVTGGGAAKCWGYNGSGELGNNSNNDSFDEPVNVFGLDAGITAVTAGIYHSCALTATGAVKCWGDNHLDQLGHDSTLTKSLTPVDVIGLATWIDAISAGATHTCALTTDGGVKCWGDNSYGKLGDGTTADSTVPVDVLTAVTCYQLSRTHSGGGSDPVANPNHTSGCPADHYLAGANITVIAVADAGWRVNGWTGSKNDASLSDINNLTMPAKDATVSVTYAACRALTTAHTGSGGDPNPAPTHSANCAEGSYVSGETIALIAGPEAGQRVKQWIGADTAPGAGALANTLTMPDAAASVSVEYEPCFALSTNISGSGGALTVTPASSAGCFAGGFAAGESIGLVASPSPGWVIEKWTGTSDDQSTAVSNTVVMPFADHIAGVTYAHQQYTDGLYLPVLRR